MQVRSDVKKYRDLIVGFSAGIAVLIGGIVTYMVFENWY